MLEMFYPRKYVDNTYQIPFQKFYDKGIRGVIFDIDNTLVPHGVPADERVIRLFEDLRRMGLDTCLLSNNKEPRVAAFAGQVQSKYISKGGKPSVRNYNRAMELLKTTRDSTIFVGDQIFTDVYGANQAGIYSILVKPIHPKEEIQIVVKRSLEAVVLYFYRRSMKRKSKPVKNADTL